MAASEVARAFSRFRQLSALGLGGEAVMPALVSELHVLLPSLRAMFFFANRSGGLDHVYTESVENAAITSLYLREFHGRREPPGLSFADAMRSQVGVHDLEAMRVDEKGFSNTDFYNLLFRPVGRGPNYVRLVMRDRGRGLGMVTIFREPGDRHFSDEEKRRLASLEPFFVHALKHKPDPDPVLAPDATTGLIIADTEGRLKHLSRRGRELMYRAFHPRLSSGAAAPGWTALPAPLHRLCRDLGRIAAEADIGAPPGWYTCNIWGGFDFRAQLLEGVAGDQRLVAISVTHREPVAIRMVRRAGQLPISARQAEVCVELAKGASNEEIAERLGISKHTAITHGRWIYNKLNVHSRAELVARLLSDGQ